MARGCHASPMRLLYTCLLYLAAPVILMRLLWRSQRQPEYRRRIRERLGYISRPEGPVTVWIHAVSVGESVAALPLIEALIARYGERRIWVTTTTPTGSARIVSALGSRVMHSYAPYDWPGAVARFLKQVRPSQIVVMETEIWPNLFHLAAKADIPLVIANARLSPHSYRNYLRLRGPVARVLKGCSVIAAQSDHDAHRFTALGAPCVRVTGNLKFELNVPETHVNAGRALHHAFGETRPVWVAASTHEGEESAALAAHEVVLQHFPDAALIIVPRHPQRFGSVWQIMADRGLRTARRSGNQLSNLGTVQVYLGDTMGEMYMYLAAADVAFVGGSLVRIGGHNILEPAALAIPVLFGPHMYNFEAARMLLLKKRAAVQVSTPADLADTVIRLFSNAAVRSQLGEAGRLAVESNRGALIRLLEILDTALSRDRTSEPHTTTVQTP